MTRTTVVLLAASLATGCGGSPSPSAPSTPTVPQIAGTYAGPTTDTSISPPTPTPLWTTKFFRARDNRPFFSFGGCSGTVVLQQTGSTFTGSFTQGGTCAEVSGAVTNGTIRSDGTVTFSLAGPASDPLAWTTFAGCSAAIAGTMDFSGTVTNGLLDASFAHDAIIDCPKDGSVTVNVHLRGTR
jgi:hypothetical protein